MMKKLKKSRCLALLLAAAMTVSVFPVGIYVEAGAQSTLGASSAAGSSGASGLFSSTGVTGQTGVQAGAVPRLVSGVYDLDGDGVKDEVYEIANATQLEWLADKVNRGGGQLNAVLIADIDLTGVTHTPIGVLNSEFTGIFDGRGHAVRNMNFTTAKNGYNGQVTYDNQGLFGVIRGGALVRNLTVYGEIVLAAGGQKYIGGAVGLAYEDAKITNVTSYVHINDADTAYENITQIGGVVGQLGYSNGSVHSAAVIENCQYYGTIRVNTAASIGGIAGQGIRNSRVLKCSNYGTVGWNYIGHAAGVIGSAQTGTLVKDCVNYGSVSICRNDCIGGVVGYANEYVSIQGCANFGTVTAKKSGKANEPDVYLGGILGYVNNGNFAGLTDCFNFGKVTDGDNANTNTGALVGLINSATNANVIQNNTYDTNSCGKAYGSNSSTTKPGTPATAQAVTASSTTWSTGWHVVTGKVTIDKRVNATGDVKLVLADGANLIINGGILVGTGQSLTVYGVSAPALNEDQSVDFEQTVTGKLTVQNVADYNAAIGGHGDATTGLQGCGTIIIHGGVLNVTAGVGGTAIGGAYGTKQNDFYIEINGGAVNAYSSSATAIGCGINNDGAGRVVINGGHVVATGGRSSSAIGCGSTATMQSIVINGGVISAYAQYAPAIGAGCSSRSGETSTLDELIINGGTVKAVSSGESPAIGQDTEDSLCRSLVIRGGNVTAYGGVELVAIHAQVMQIEDFCRILAVGKNEDGRAFATAPTFVNDIAICISVGTSESTLTPVENPDIPTLCTQSVVVCLERCRHEKMTATYRDESSHTLSCTYCDFVEDVSHDFSQNGLCVCNRWQGNYLDYNASSGSLETKLSPTAIPVIDGMATLTTGWYVVIDSRLSTGDTRVTVQGDVHLILADGVSYTTRGLDVAEGNSLTIYAQSQPVLDAGGTLDETRTTTGRLKSTDFYNNAAIGSSKEQNSGRITINGGVIEANATGYTGGAGIGSGMGGKCGPITINGGHITAGSYRDGAGVGTGKVGDTLTDITINGGSVTAYCTSGNGVGIGVSGNRASGTVTVNGGRIQAKGSDRGSGIAAGQIVVTDFELLTVYTVGGESVAFSVAPTFSVGDQRIKISYGDDADYIKAMVSGDDRDSITTGYAYVLIEKCAHLMKYTYQNNATHGYACQWCGLSGTEDHVYDTEDHTCICEKSLYPYRAYNVATGRFETKNSQHALIIESTTRDWLTGWYVVDGQVTIDGDVTVTGDVHLILLEGATLTVNGSIKVYDDDSNASNGSPNSLTVYAQSDIVTKADGTWDETQTTAGCLTVAVNASTSHAGIGGGRKSNTGAIAIHGGVITATGGAYSAGIGGYENSGSITIHGGVIQSTGGTDAAGIGHGPQKGGGNITINGGIITATGGARDAYYAGSAIGSSFQWGGTVTINGGRITCFGGYYAVGGPNDEGSITINHVDSLLMTSPQQVFSSTPTIADSFIYRLSTGTSVENMALVIYDQRSNLNATCVMITTCTDHTDTRAEYLSDEAHRLICRWCGTVERDEVHDFVDNACICGSCIVSYEVYRPESKTFVTETHLVSHKISESDTAWPAGWYLVTGEVTIPRWIATRGDVHLILGDGAHLTVNGIGVYEGSTLTVYAQSRTILLPDGTLDETNNLAGKLTSHTTIYNASGIGGYQATAGTIIFHGGVISAKGGENAAGIGGGKGGNGGNITIYDGVVSATGGRLGAGIGGGKDGSGSSFTMYGGIIKVQGGTNGAGIGGGERGNGGGNITIYDGVVSATGGHSGAGIGGGYAEGAGSVTINGGTVTANGGHAGAGIGSGNYGKGGAITINGGTVTANGASYSAGIGGGNYGKDLTIIIAGGTVKAKGGTAAAGIGDGDTGSDVTSNVTISGGTVTAVGDVDNTKEGSYAFKVNVITFADGYCFRVSRGDNEASLAAVLHKDKANTIFNTSNVVRIEPCTTHHRGGDSLGEAGHTAYCAWCNQLFGEEAHTYGADGVCTACGAWSGSYLVFNTTSRIFETKQKEAVTPLGSSTGWTAGWYVVSGSLTISNRVTVTGDVHLILLDGASLTVNGGIGVNEGNSLTVYAVSHPVLKSDGTLDEVNNTTGKLSVTGNDQAGIGGRNNQNAGTITFHGGVISAQGGRNSAGIGGGRNGQSGQITINGGMVTAIGGESGAGIGSGLDYIGNSSGHIIINGGTVTATGGELSAGIGGGQSSPCPEITINGGTIMATGGYGGPGFGYGRDGLKIKSGSIIINGGTIIAIGGQSRPAFSLAPTLKDTLTWEISAGNDMAGLAVVTSPNSSTYTEKAVVKIVNTSVGEIVSLDITWESLEFTYTNGAWDPVRHDYADGSWTTNGGVITVTNRGNVALSVAFAFTANVNGISGSFTKDSCTVAMGGSEQTRLTLTGRPGEHQTSLGTVAVTVSRAQKSQ